MPQNLTISIENQENWTQQKKKKSWKFKATGPFFIALHRSETTSDKILKFMQKGTARDRYLRTPRTMAAILDETSRKCDEEAHLAVNLLFSPSPPLTAPTTSYFFRHVARFFFFQVRQCIMMRPLFPTQTHFSIHNLSPWKRSTNAMLLTIRLGVIIIQIRAFRCPPLFADVVYRDTGLVLLNLIVLGLLKSWREWNIDRHDAKLSRAALRTTGK